LPFPNCAEPANLDESYRRGEKTDEDLRRATCFENYGFLSLTQNGANYKFNKKKICNRTDGKNSKQLG